MDSDHYEFSPVLNCRGSGHLAEIQTDQNFQHPDDKVFVELGKAIAMFFLGSLFGHRGTMARDFTKALDAPHLKPIQF